MFIRKLVAASILSVSRRRSARSLTHDLYSSGCFSAKASNAALPRKLTAAMG